MNHPSVSIWTWVMTLLLISAFLSTSSAQVNSDAHWEVASFSVKVYFEMPYGDFMHSTVILSNNRTALNATEKACSIIGIPLKYTWSRYGAFVESINNFSMPPDYSWWWMLLIWNDSNNCWEESHLGASALNLSPGDSIAWCPNSTAPPPFSPVFEEFKTSFLSQRIQKTKLSSYNIFMEKNLESGAIDTTPCVVNGKIYISTGGVYDWKNMKYKKMPNIYCLDIKSGNLIWHTEIDAHGWQISSPAYGAGAIYIGSTDGNLYALSASTGDVIWKLKTNASITSSPIFVSGKIYVVDGNGTLLCINKDGDVVWRYECGDGNYMSSPIPFGDGFIYGTDAGMLYYVIDGKCVWKIQLDGKIRATPVISEDKVYVISTEYANWIPNKSRIYAISDGKIIHERNIDASVSSPLIFKNRIYLGTFRGLLCLDMNLNLIWEYYIDEIVQCSPCTDGEKIFFATNTNDGKVYGCTEDGYKVWNITIGDYILSSPVIVNGMLIICSDDGYVRIFGNMIEKKINVEIYVDEGIIFAYISSLSYSGKVSIIGEMDGEHHRINFTICPHTNATFGIKPQLTSEKEFVVKCFWNGGEYEEKVKISSQPKESMNIDSKIVYFIIGIGILLFLMLVLWWREKEGYEDE